MTAYEYLDLAQSGLANSISLLTFGFSVLCGYLLVAFLLGSKLTTFQVVAITVIYTVTVFFNLAAQLLSMMEIAEFQRLAVEIQAEQTIRYYPNALFGVIFIRCAMYFASLWFMWSIRHPKSE